MLWFVDENGDAWPGTTGPIHCTHDRTDDNRDVWRTCVGEAVILTTADADEAHAVHAALLEIIARHDFGLVRCRVRTGAKGQREAVAALDNDGSLSGRVVQVAPKVASGGHSETPTSGGETC